MSRVQAIDPKTAAGAAAALAKPPNANVGAITGGSLRPDPPLCEGSTP